MANISGKLDTLLTQTKTEDEGQFYVKTHSNICAAYSETDILTKVEKD